MTFSFTYHLIDGSRWTKSWQPPPARIAQDQARMMRAVNPSGKYHYYEHRTGQYFAAPDPTVTYDTGSRHVGAPPLKGANHE